MAATLDIVGKILVSYTVLKVHYRLLKEHRIDDAVCAEMRFEHVIGYLGIGLMIGAYLLKMLHSAGVIG